MSFLENQKFPVKNLMNDINKEADNLSDISFEKNKKNDNELLNYN